MADQPGSGGTEKPDLHPDLWRAYTDLARARYQQEEERWRSAQDKAKTVFAVAAIVAGLAFSRLDWAVGAVRSTCYYALWLVLFFLAASALLASIICVAVVAMPRPIWSFEDPDTTLSNLAKYEPKDGPEYVGKAFDFVVRRNDAQITHMHRWTRAAIVLLVVSLGLAMCQVVTVVLACNSGRMGDARMAVTDPAITISVGTFPASDDKDSSSSSGGSGGGSGSDKPDPGGTQKLKHESTAPAQSRRAERTRETEDRTPPRERKR